MHTWPQSKRFHPDRYGLDPKLYYYPAGCTLWVEIPDGVDKAGHFGVVKGREPKDLSWLLPEDMRPYFLSFLPRYLRLARDRGYYFASPVRDARTWVLEHHGYLLPKDYRYVDVRVQWTPVPSRNHFFAWPSPVPYIQRLSPAACVPDTWKLVQVQEPPKGVNKKPPLEYGGTKYPVAQLPGFVEALYEQALNS